MDKSSKAEYTFSVVARPLKKNMQDLRFSLIIGGAAKRSSHLFDLRMKNKILFFH